MKLSYYMTHNNIDLGSYDNRLLYVGVEVYVCMCVQVSVTKDNSHLYIQHTLLFSKVLIT